MNTFKISRPLLFLVGLVVIFSLYFFQRWVTYSRSEFTHGVLICEDRSALKYYETDMTLYYYVGMREYHVTVTENTNRAFQKVEVRYLPEKPERGHIYRAGDFWFLSMLWMIFPVMLWIAFVFTLLREDGFVVLTWRGRGCRNKIGKNRNEIESIEKKL